MICKKEIMPVGSDEYACEFRNFDFHERRAAPRRKRQEAKNKLRRRGEVDMSVRRSKTKVLVDGGDSQETVRVKGLIGFVDGQTT
jgi:hypothetical protein